MSRKQERQITKVLLPQDIREAEDKVVQLHWHEAFVNEYKAKEPKSPLIKLNPVLNEDGH